MLYIDVIHQCLSKTVTEQPCFSESDKSALEAAFSFCWFNSAINWCMKVVSQRLGHDVKQATMARLIITTIKVCSTYHYTGGRHKLSFQQRH